MALEADLGRSTQSWVFRDAFPERHFEMGIAEDNMISTAAGLALSGKMPFVHSFSVFATGRSYDQIRASVCLGNLSVRIVGSSCGLSDYGDGATHQCLEDIALMRALPNMTILAPADGIETAKVVRAAASHRGPIYIRINRNDIPVVTREDEPLRIGVPSVVRQGGDVTVFANGYMVYKALCAAEQLQEQGISLRVVNVSTLKPIDAAGRQRDGGRRPGRRDHRRAFDRRRPGKRHRHDSGRRRPADQVHRRRRPLRPVGPGLRRVAGTLRTY